MLPGKPPRKPHSNTLHVMIGTQRIECGVSCGSGPVRQWIKESVLEFVIAEADELFSLFQMLAATLQRLQALNVLPEISGVRVVTADSWLAVAGVPWSTALKSRADADFYARTQLSGVGFDVTQEDLVKLDDAPFGTPRLIVAYPAKLLATLNNLTAHLGARLDSLLPLSVAGWKLMRRVDIAPSQALAVLSEGLLLVARSTSPASSRLGEVTVRVVAKDSLPGDQCLTAIWQRLCLREPQLAALGDLALLDMRGGSEPSCSAGDTFRRIELPPQTTDVHVSSALHLVASLHRPQDILDAVSGLPTKSLGGWLLLSVVTLLAGWMTFQVVRANDAVNSAMLRLDAATKALQPPPRPTAWSREEIARVHIVNGAIRQLNMPIAAILRALEPPQDIRAAVLSVEAASGATAVQVSSVKIVAEARSSAEMARYVAFVAERKPFTGAYLTRHEIDDAVPDSPYRFTVEAIWNE